MRYQYNITTDTYYHAIPCKNKKTSSRIYIVIVTLLRILKSNLVDRMRYFARSILTISRYNIFDENNEKP